ncbi:XamI family restriction endonuclease [Nonomuraea sp. LP-02]|uniref:XamI family restriction endonuclease n=1 Tax=Nonomuraea sp. LP-02 TaxID=3097960 RepID=UPI002E3147D1|nr:XamI family restriction endonuclease [Nonomuraea sp. LP-02]MED7930417.1 XamI family restriction endonuclease [Nonomuraea sp. LP-02]
MPGRDKFQLWTSDELEADRKRSADIFRDERLTEETQEYHDRFDKNRDLVDALLAETRDLRDLSVLDPPTLAKREFLKPFRYIAGPPISEGDLQEVTGLSSVSEKEIRNNFEARDIIVQVIYDGHDRSRFPWIGHDYEPDEHETTAAALATAALMSANDSEVARKAKQRAKVEKFCKGLEERGFEKVKSRKIQRREDLPGPGQFCGRASIKDGDKGGQADFVIRRWDGLAVPVECKSSSTELNSHKRIFVETVPRAEGWKEILGSSTVSAAILAGPYAINDLQDAQTRGLAIWWFHDLSVAYDFLAKG